MSKTAHTATKPLAPLLGPRLRQHPTNVKLSPQLVTAAGLQPQNTGNAPDGQQQGAGQINQSTPTMETPCSCRESSCFGFFFFLVREAFCRQTTHSLEGGHSETKENKREHTCATPSSQPRITSCLPSTNLKGLFLSREESNFFPSSSIPVENAWEHEQQGVMTRGESEATSEANPRRQRGRAGQGARPEEALRCPGRSPVSSAGL